MIIIVITPPILNPKTYADTGETEMLRQISMRADDVLERECNRDTSEERAEEDNWRLISAALWAKRCEHLWMESVWLQCNCATSYVPDEPEHQGD